MTSSPDNERRGRTHGALAILTVLSIAIPIAGLFAVLALEGHARDSNSHGRNVGPAVVGEPAPDFSLPTLDDVDARLSQYRGRPIVVTFFASWCYPCEKEMPRLETASRRAGDALQVLAVSYDDQLGDSAAFREEHGISFPMLVDHDHSVARAYGVRAIPQTFFIDAGGVVRRHIFGSTTTDDLDALLHTVMPSSK